jgi:CRISPR-associated exonuclease Cas4
MTDDSPIFPEDQFIPISALQHWLYCPRQYALIHLEQVWAENRFTAEGRVLHENAHEGADETKGRVRITRGMAVASPTLGMSGQCDVVEFHADGKVLAVEYKRGKPKAHRADEVQLCAQAMCLEEMLDCVISNGALFYGEKRRRTDVQFDDDLRNLVKTTLEEVRACFISGKTPLAEYNARRCDACSLIDECQPTALRFKKGVSTWFATNLKSQIS